MRGLPKAYDPQGVEAKWYRFWREGGYFTPRIDPQRKPFVIIMPPPNVTGELHLGHALTVTLEDILTRWHRMKGDPTLWLPGVDHAGIAAQNVVEQALAAEGLTRHALGREGFLGRMWQWTGKYRQVIAEQHQRLGASCDWTRERFTLDEGPSKAVRTTFVNLYKKGLVYRGERIINWCPRCATALSDLEVDHKEVSDYLYHVRYPLEGGGEVTVATTRPETILGDTAVAVNPEDERFRGLVGRKALLPVLGRPIPVIADPVVDPGFGAGALKITPAHDPVDFEVAQRHGLSLVNILNSDGTMNERAGPYQGLDRFACRQALLADLQREGLLVKREPYIHSVGHCQRCQTMVEPWASKQWFIRVAPLAEPALQAVKEGRIVIIPERFTKVYLHWMENLRDWCISRQLWWGHRIPAWYCAQCDAENIYLMITKELSDKYRIPRPLWQYSTLRQSGPTHGEILQNLEELVIELKARPIVGETEPEECPKCHGKDLVQDPDVLDTWFSSALWPHSTLGWPERTEDLAYFYPTSVMETGYDILFFWVARMIMMGLFNTGDIPFHTVYLHGLIRDEKGEKMSKTRGNVVDPMQAIERYGTDALRFALSTGNTPGNDMKLTPQKLEGGRNFANKLWNAARFILSNIEEDALKGSGGPLAVEDRWILSRLNRLIASVNGLLESFQLGEAGQQIHDFLWGEFCDWYIEMAKIRLRSSGRSPVPVLVQVLENSLRLLHPFMPFLSEEMWQRLKERLAPGEPTSLCVAPYPTAEEQAFDPMAEEEMATVIGIVRAIRNARAEARVEPGRFIEALIAPGEEKLFLQSHLPTIKALARAHPVSIVVGGVPRRGEAVNLVVGGVEVVLPLAGMMDLDAQRWRLEKEVERCRLEVEHLERKLGDADFLAKAPPPVVEGERGRLGRYRSKLAKLKERLSGLR